MAREGLTRAEIAAYGSNVARRQYRTRLQLLATPVLTGEVGVEYAGFTLAAEGGTQPYEFFIKTNILPEGLTLDPVTGEVSGTPEAAGAYTDIELGVRDDAGRVAFLPPFTITITGE